MTERSDRLSEQYERKRLLRLLSRRAAVLEEPFVNPIIQKLIDEKLATVTKRQKFTWSSREHDCAYISLTDKGREALACS